jgi:tetratricopeptide (TPR) repeat protein
MTLNDFPLRDPCCSLPSPFVNSIGKKSAQYFLFLVLFVISQPSVRAEDVTTAETLAVAPATLALSNSIAEIDAQLLKNFLLLQDQLRNTQRAVEQGREQAAADARRADDLLTARLNLVEQSLTTQRAQELVALQESTRAVITIASVIMGTGLLVVLFAGFAQVRAMTRLTEVSRQLSLALPAPHLGEVPAHALLLGRESIQASNANLLDAINRLERRLEEMETRVSEKSSLSNGHKQIPAPTATSPAPGNSQLATLLGQGQALLNLDKAEEALDHFDEALRLEPRNVEAWIKKGTALERLQRTDEAIVAYDQAIAVDGSIATAYLFKAGVYNRQKKYAEALQCYEKALGAQQKSRAQSVRT